MIKLKKPEEYLKIIIDDMFEPTNRQEANRRMMVTIANIQKDSYNQAIDDASNEAEADFEPMGWLAEQHLNNAFVEGKDYEVPVIRNSILKLKIE